MIERSKEFITLALKLSYTAAAEELHMSTSALSRHIASLESSLGFTLLNRDPLSLTEAGQYYLEAASLLIEDFDRIVEEGRRIASQSTNHLTVYMLPVRTAFSDVIYQAAAHMRRENPGLSINFCVDDRFHTAEEALLCGKADLGVVFDHSIADDSPLTLTPFARSPLCVWVHRNNPLALQESVSIQDLSQYVYPKSTNRQSHDAANSIAWTLESENVNIRVRLRNIESRIDYFLTLREDEFLIEFAEEEGYERLNPDLVKLPFQKTITAPIYMAYSHKTTNPLRDEFMSLIQSLSQEKGLLEDA